MQRVRAKSGLLDARCRRVQGLAKDEAAPRHRSPPVGDIANRRAVIDASRLNCVDELLPGRDFLGECVQGATAIKSAKPEGS